MEWNITMESLFQIPLLNNFLASDSIKLTFFFPAIGGIYPEFDRCYESTITWSCRILFYLLSGTNTFEVIVLNTNRYWDTDYTSESMAIVVVSQGKKKKQPDCITSADGYLLNWEILLSVAHPIWIREWFFSSICHYTASHYTRSKGNTIPHLPSLCQLWSLFMAIILDEDVGRCPTLSMLCVKWSSNLF